MTPTRARAVADIMRTVPWLTLDDLLEELGSRGVPTTTEQFTEVWHDSSLGDLAQVDVVDPPLVVNLPAVLVGRVFTHRLSAQEVERDELATVPDFAGIWPLIDGAPFNELDGKRIEDGIDAESLAPVIRLAHGTLAGYPAEQLIAITVTPTGLHLAAASEPESDQLTHQSLGFFPELLEVFGDDIRRTPMEYEWDDELGVEENLQMQEEFEAEQEAEADLADGIEPVGAVPLEEYLLLACVRHPDLFTEPGWPVTDVLERQQLDHEDGMVAVPGFDFATASEVAGEAAELERISETYELADSESRAVLAFTDKVTELHDAIHDWVDGGEREEDFPEIDVLTILLHLAALAEPMVSVAIADESLGGDPHLASMLAMILETVRPQTPRRALGGWHWLLGRCHDLLSDVAEAEREYLRALDLDADFYPAMRELATLASLQGDASRAVSLLQRAAVPNDDPELVMVSRFVAESRPDLGRNDPCWCGSGNKYKRCHLHRSEFDLASRRDWLYEKVAGWARNSSGRELIIELAAASVDPAQGPDALLKAVLDPLFIDLAIFEGGLLELFRESRAFVLPADERELLGEWAASRRMLGSVQSFDRFSGLTIKDLGSDVEVHTVDRAVAVKAGDLVCLRLLPAGGTLAAPGGIVVVPPAQRELTLAMLALQGTDDEDPVRTARVLTGRMTD